jgi:ribosomal protein S18 acetylase RimI-like enzyme
MIRKFEEKDKELYLQLALEFYNSEAVLHSIKKENMTATWDEMMRSDVYAEGFLCLDGNVPVGYLLIAKTFSQEAGGLTIWAEELYVRPEFRGKGAGSEMLEFLFKNRPAVRYRLEIEPENVRAKKLYTRLGFESLPYGQMVKDKK